MWNLFFYFFCRTTRKPICMCVRICCFLSSYYHFKCLSKFRNNKTVRCKECSWKINEIIKIKEKHCKEADIKMVCQLTVKETDTSLHVIIFLDLLRCAHTHTHTEYYWLLFYFVIFISLTIVFVFGDETEQIYLSKNGTQFRILPGVDKYLLNFIKYAGW